MQQLMTMDDALHQLLDVGGSDLIFSCGSQIRMRRDGDLENLDQHSRVLVPSDTQRMVREILNDKQWKELHKRRHVDFSFTWRERARIRGNAYFQRNSIAAAFRHLPLTIPNFDMLGIPEAVHRLLQRQHGLILVTGPTGCGKSTTQAAMIDLLNTTRPFHIITIEDPIEYVHKHKLSIVDQRQVGDDVPSFAEGLRAAFREDPDVVLIGEMRDLETMSAAVSIAESGHLVLATLHTNDAPQALDRIIDSYLGAQQQQVRIQLGGGSDLPAARAGVGWRARGGLRGPDREHGGAIDDQRGPDRPDSHRAPDQPAGGVTNARAFPESAGARGPHH
jgi:twitching motility protein PilT